MHKSRRVLNRLRRNRVNVAKMFARPEDLPFDLDAANENAARLDIAEHIQPDPVDPLPSPGVREPTVRGARTARGNSIYDNHVVHHESELEHRGSKRMQARRDVVNLVSQPYKIRFVDQRGEYAHHIVDFHVDFDDGLRVAVAMKPEAKAKKLAELLERVVNTGQVVRKDGSHGELSEAFDTVTIITEEWASLDEDHNARFILWALKKPKAQACPIVRERALHLRSAKVRYIDLIAGLPDDGPRRIAFWLLVYAGVLVPEEPGRIDDLTWMVVNCDAATPE